MGSPETDTIKGLLQSLEHSLDATYRVTGLCRHLLNAQRDGTKIVPSAVQRYEEQLTEPDPRSGERATRSSRSGRRIRGATIVCTLCFSRLALMNSYVERTRLALSFVDIGIASAITQLATVHQILGTPELTFTTEQKYGVNATVLLISGGV